MKYIKPLFVVSLVNLAIILSVVGVINYKNTLELAPPVEQVTVTPVVTNVPTKAITQMVAPTDGRCLITVRGSQYDVTDFRNRHQGGDIFQCGTDMTDIFNSEHSSSYLRKMARYKI